MEFMILRLLAISVLRKKNEGSKLPPTKGALQKHLERAHYQILQWNFSYLAEIPEKDPLNHGWVLKNEKY